MLLEVKILTGARAGQTKRLEKPVISVGRNPDVDIRFDPLKDLDVSGRHAEFRAKGAGYELHDLGSTNGTFVNGERLNGSCVLRTADTIRFGANGPEVDVSFHVTGAIKVVGATEERIAFAVKKQTAGMRRIIYGGLGFIALGVAAAYYVGQRSSTREIEGLRKQLEANDARLHTMQNGLPEGDTALANAFERQFDALNKRLKGATTDEERKQLTAELAVLDAKMTGLVRMDPVAINNRNSPGVALLISKIGTQAFAGTAFAITERGLMLTNRHNVRDGDQVASAVAIKFRDDSMYYPAHIVKMPPVGDSLDLALIQLDDSLAGYSTVAGIQGRDENMDEGAPIVLIGFPLGYDIAQEGNGDRFIAKTTLFAGAVSKRTASILQIDSYAAHGSSGSPIFSAKGQVIGVVWGGPKDAGGRIVYAVPRERIIAFLPDQVRALVVR